MDTLSIGRKEESSGEGGKVQSSFNLEFSFLSILLDTFFADFLLKNERKVLGCLIQLLIEKEANQLKK